MFNCEFKTGGAAFREPCTGDEDDFQNVQKLLESLEKSRRNWYMEQPVEA